MPSACFALLLLLLAVVAAVGCAVRPGAALGLTALAGLAGLAVRGSAHVVFLLAWSMKNTRPCTVKKTRAGKRRELE
jgi:hypothetical protein